VLAVVEDEEHRAVVDLFDQHVEERTPRHFRNPERRIDVQAVEGTAGDVNFDREVRWRVGTEVDVGLSPHRRFVLNVVALVWL